MPNFFPLSLILSVMLSLAFYCDVDKEYFGKRKEVAPGRPWELTTARTLSHKNMSYYKYENEFACNRFVKNVDSSPDCSIFSEDILKL